MQQFFVLGERIERNLYDLLETLRRAKYSKPRQESLAKANLMLEILRFQMRRAKDWPCLKVESDGLAAKAMDERSANSSAAGSRAVAGSSVTFGEESKLPSLYERLGGV
jgi:hypothetical protein